MKNLTAMWGGWVMMCGAGAEAGMILNTKKSSSFVIMYVPYYICMNIHGHINLETSVLDVCAVPYGDSPFWER